jgi:hypothetical protein
MSAPLPRCPQCRYVLMRDLTCPIHGGRQVSDRLPLLSPLPLAASDPKVLGFKRTRTRTRRSA